MLKRSPWLLESHGFRFATFLSVLMSVALSPRPARGQARSLSVGKVVADVAFSPDGRLLAVAGKGGIAVLWNWTTREKQVTLRGSRNLINRVRFSPDGKLVVTASFDGLVRFWDPVTGTETRRLEVSRTSPVYDLAFSPTGKTLVTSSWVHEANTIQIHLWEVATHKLRLLIQQVDMNAVAFSPDGKTLALAGGDRDKRTGMDLPTNGGHPVKSV